MEVTNDETLRHNFLSAKKARLFLDLNSFTLRPHGQYPLNFTELAIEMGSYKLLPKMKSL